MERIRNKMGNGISEVYSSFKIGKERVDQIFVVRWVNEKYFTRKYLVVVYECRKSV